MDTHDPDILLLLGSLERTSNAPVALTTTTAASGAFNAIVSYCYMQDGKIATREIALDEPLASDVSAEKRRDRVIVLLRRALQSSRGDGKVIR